jgi:hypothetical protein
MPTCPNGHRSVATDYCDQCGAKLDGGPPSAAPPPPQGPAPLDPALAAPGPATATCPNCQSPSGPDDKFCEVCGFDFAAGTLPAAPVPVAASPAPDPLPASPATTPAATGPVWAAIVAADRAYYERTSPDGVPFPEHCPERTFTLTQDEVLVGRRSESRGIHPEIDLSGAPEDTAVSRSHAVLRRQPDGSYLLVDPGSTNGTHLNDDPAPLQPGLAVPVKDGDRIYVGAWTRITLRAPGANAPQ